MTLDLLLKLLRCHLAALQSTAWPRPHGPSNGPAIYLDAADTSALITELAGIQRKLETAGLGGDAIGRAESGAARSVENNRQGSRRGKDDEKRAGAVRDAHGRTHTEIRHGRDRPRLNSLAIIASTAETSGPRDVVASGLAPYEAVTTTALHSRRPLRRYACGIVASK